MQKVIDGLKYSLYLIFHPFKAFWNLKHEKKGNIGSASVIIFFVFVTLVVKRQFSGFIFNHNKIEELNIFVMLASVVLPFILWGVSNWCITTLVDGEGTFMDIIISSAYALMPFVLIQLPLSILSNFISLDESGYYTFLAVISIVWSVFLMIVGIMTVHQFTMAKTIGSIIIAVIGMIIIVFLFFLLFVLIQQFINFFLLIEKELAMR